MEEEEEEDTGAASEEVMEDLMALADMEEVLEGMEVMGVMVLMEDGLEDGLEASAPSVAEVPAAAVRVKPPVPARALEAGSGPSPPVSPVPAPVPSVAPGELYNFTIY